MPEPSSYRIVLWSLVIFVLVVATPGWYIQMQLGKKVYLLEERVAALEEQVEELKSPPADGPGPDAATAAEDDGP